MIFELFRNKRQLDDDALVRPFTHKAKEAMRRDDMPNAVAFLTRAIELAPDRMDLILMRAQVYQYGMGDYSCALRDYRLILNHLEQAPDNRLQRKCREGMADMMSD